jgi:predicted DNA-binding protein with PD1-like motif
MRPRALRLEPGQDLRGEIEAFVLRERIEAGVILTCVGSLRKVALRPAGQEDPLMIDEDFEIVSLVGTLSTEGCHLHISVSDPHGVTMGGHLLKGCEVRTTAEIVVLSLEGLRFGRELDPKTGYKELVIRS